MRVRTEEPVLALDGLTKRYARGAEPAVRDVAVEVDRGEILAVVGESGCGKTTLLRLVAGLETADTGTIRIGGRTMDDGRLRVPPERRGVGVVFQEFALFPHMTALQNILYGLAALPRAQRRARAERMLELVGLTGYGGRYPHQLSGGQQQRVALARSLAPEPSLLLLDEPFSNLDTALKRSLRDELGDILRSTGTTTLLVVHDPEDVLALADRAAVMRAGRLLQHAEPSTLYRRPADEYVAQFFGEANVLAGRPCAGGFQTELGIVPCEAAAGCRSRAVRLCLRPEDLRISVSGEGRPALVERIRDVGFRRRVLVRLENGVAPGAALIVETGHQPPLSEGDRVFISPRPESVHLFAGTEGRVQGEA